MTLLIKTLSSYQLIDIEFWKHSWQLFLVYIWPSIWPLVLLLTLAFIASVIAETMIWAEKRKRRIAKGIRFNSRSKRYVIHMEEAKTFRKAI